MPSPHLLRARLSRALCRASSHSSLLALPPPARPPPSAAWSPTPPAPRSPAPMCSHLATEGRRHRCLHGRRQLSDSDRGRRAASSWWSRPRAFASWRRRVSMPAGSIPSSATWCWNRSGCASPSWSRPPERPRRSRRPARPPACLARSIWLCATT